MARTEGSLVESEGLPCCPRGRKAFSSVGSHDCTVDGPATPRRDGVRRSAGTLRAFEGARVIPGDGRAPIEDAVFVVRDGRIEAIGPRGAVERPAGVATVELSGKTVMPTLVNVHGHVGYLRGAETSSEHYDRENVLDHLRRSVY